MTLGSSLVLQKLIYGIVYIMTTELVAFLKKYVSTGVKDKDGNSVFTHTTMQQPRASYNIPEDQRDELHKFIARSIIAKKQMYITEKPMPIKPITVDIDLQYPIDLPPRQHNERHIKELLKLYSEAIITYVDIPEDKPIDAYIFERPYPYPSNGNIKDGIHIMYPHINTCIELQHAIRDYVVKKLGAFLNNADIGRLAVKNSPEDIIDIAVIDRNNWTVYGCQKPGVRPYVLAHVYRLDNTGSEMKFDEVDVPHTTEEDLTNLVKDLAIQYKPADQTYGVREEHQDIIDSHCKKMEEKKQRKYAPTNFIKKQIKAANSDEDTKRDMEEAEALVKLLALWRSDDTKHWINVGLCLHNISPALQNVWTMFSRRSDQYREGDENRWHGFEDIPGGLGIGALHRWARLDNPLEYKTLQSELLHPLMLSSVCGSSQDVAAVVHKMYKHQFVCLDAKGKKWAIYVNHGWKITQEGIGLKKKIGHEVLNEYLNLVSYYNHQAVLYSDDRKDQQLHKSKSLTDVTYKLRDITFKEKIMKECIILFHDATFEDELNTNSFLVGMENGVYDLAAGVFRNGSPEDKISISTSNDFPDFDPSDIDIENETSSIPQVEAIFDFMKQVFPIAPVRFYTYRYLSSNLQGYNTDEKFHIWTGSGGNGKSKLLELFEMAFGEYCFKLPITILTHARGQAGQATPELCMSKGRRFGSAQEPDEGAKINTSLMKEWSGNDKVYIRGLYAEGSIIKPMFSMALLCNNKPKIPTDDDGTWRRMVVIEFISKFVEGQPKGPHEFTRNTHLVHLFPEWAPWFFVILTLWYKIYRTDGLNPPEEVMAAGYEYRKHSDAYALFIDTYFKKDSEGMIRVDDSYAVFKEWYFNELGEKAPIRRDYKVAIERKLSQPYGSGGKAGWYGYSMQHPDALAMMGKKDVPDMERSHLDEAPPVTPKAPVKVPITPKAQIISKDPVTPKVPIKVPITPKAQPVPAPSVAKIKIVKK